MKRPETWLPGVTATCKVRVVARQALSVRLERVARSLKRAVKESKDQADKVHRLRTGCRRSAAAVVLFRPLLPKKKARWFVRQLKRVRQAAGDVRDLDVMLEQATSDPPLAEELTKQREKALKPLKKLRRHLHQRGRFDKRQRRLLEDIEQPRDRLGEWGANRIRKQVVVLAALGEKSLKSLEAAHAFRIAGKELRYVLEIIGNALPLAAMNVYALLGDLQQRIGFICDHAAAERMYRELLGKVGRSHQQPLRDAIAKAQKEMARRHRAFLRWWTPRRRKAFRGALAQAGLLAEQTSLRSLAKGS